MIMHGDRCLEQRLREATPAQQDLHRQFVHAIGAAKQELVRAAFCLAAIADRRLYRILGFRDVASYARAYTGMPLPQARDLVRMGRRLRELPEVRRAVAEGSLSWNKARLIVARARPETEIELISVARVHGEKELREALRADAADAPRADRGERAEAGPAAPTDSAGDDRAAKSAPGAEAKPETEPTTAPQTEPGPPPRRYHVSISLSALEYARWEVAVARLRRRAGPASLGTLHLEALELAADSGADGAACAASAHEHPHDERHRSADRPADRPGAGPGTLLVMLHCPACERADLVTARGELPAPRALLTAARCDGIVERNDGTGRVTRRGVVPPQMRRAAIRRDRYRCQAAGCGHTRNLEVHHRVPRSEGGRTELQNLVTLCRRCHHALHDEEAETAAAVEAGRKLKGRSLP